VDEITFHTRTHRPGTILDVGAHDGLLTLPLSRLPGAHVLAFEPLPSAFARLHAAVIAEYGEPPAHVELRTEALGAAPGQLSLSVPVLDGVAQEQWASLAKDYGAFASVTTERHAVAVVTVDSLSLHDLTHMKVDAEGFEEEVLQGARATLTRCRPVLSLEVEERHRAGATRDVPALLAALGYEVRFWLDGVAEFDAATISENLTAQKIALEKARAAQIQAEKDHAAAAIAVEEYAQGTFRKEQHKLQSDLTGARERLQASRNLLAHFERMFRKGYITPQELEKHKAAVERAKLDEDTAAIALDVLERFTKPKMMTELESKRDANAARKASESAALELETLKLERLEEQLTKCKITAPKDGIVIYAPKPRWDRESGTKVGAKVSETQVVLQMPDLSSMRADVGVHESRVEKIRPGMRARVDVQGSPFTGSVTKVANRPDANGFFDNAKRYEVVVKIDGESPLLRPGLTAEAEIVIAELHDVIAVPVAAVAEVGDNHVCVVRKATTVERRIVTLGQGNETSVEIASGLEPGEVVLLNPRSVLDAVAPPVEDRDDGGAQPGPQPAHAARS